MKFYVKRIPVFNDELQHHGIDGQKWGVRNGPPYPLDRNSKSESGDTKRFSKSEQRSNRKKQINDVEKFIVMTPDDGHPSFDTNREIFNKIKSDDPYIHAVTNTKEYKDYINSSYNYHEYMYNAVFSNQKAKDAVYDKYEGVMDGYIAEVLNSDKKADQLRRKMYQTRRVLRDKSEELAVEYMGSKNEDDYRHSNASRGGFKLPASPSLMTEFADYDSGYNKRSWSKDMSAWNKLD